MKLSVVIPVMNEAENIKPLFAALASSLAAVEHEIVLVDDGSTDGTVSEIQAYAPTNAHLVVLNKNYGQTTAMAAGIDHAQGELIATLDGDLQNDPSDIPMMMQYLQEHDLDVVAGRRAGRQDGMILRKIPSQIANAIIRNLTNVHIHDYGCTLKVFKKDVAKNLGLYGELHRFIPVLVATLRCQNGGGGRTASCAKIRKIEIRNWSYFQSSERPVIHGFFSEIQSEANASFRKSWLFLSFYWNSSEPLPSYPEDFWTGYRRTPTALFRHYYDFYRHSAHYNRVHCRIHHAYLLRVAKQETLYR